MAPPPRRGSGACAVPLLAIGVQAIQLSPYRAGLAGHHLTRLPMALASPTCSCPLWLSPSGKSDDPEVSLRTSPDCVRDSAPRPAAHTFTAPGSTPVVLLQGQHPEAFLRISPAYTDFTVDSLRVRWIPLLQSFHRLGAFAMGTHPRVHGFPVRRLLCPLRLSPGASSMRETFPSHSFPTALTIPRGVSRVPHGRLKWNEGGGVFLSLPLPRFAAPQALDRG